MASGARRPLDCVDPLKGLALLLILWNHLTEEFGAAAWFTNPWRSWPDLGTRLRQVYPTEHAFPLSLLQLLGWLGDAGPGVFLFLSGLGLGWASLHLPPGQPWVLGFYRRRIGRIYPLYLGAHVVLIAASRLVPGAAVPLGSRETLLSALGLRFTPALFFYLSPSWWFVWLILQLYAAYPLLWWLLRRLGPAAFFALCLALTVASRLVGVLWVEQVYYWMTGLFFGCRLAEFAAGMALAVVLRGRPDALPPARVAAFAAPLYLLGLGCSITWPGSLVSNLLVTLGLTGLLYGLLGALRGARRLVRGLGWLGAASFAVYLLHHPPLLWTRALLPGGGGARLGAAVLVLLLSIPAAVALERAVAAIERWLGRWLGRWLAPGRGPRPAPQRPGISPLQ